jgi:prenyltransferase beta subunit
MLQVARLAPKLLGDSTELVAGFLRSQLNDDGGFGGRDGKSDLYYTVFGLEGLLALQAELPASRSAVYLRSFGDGTELDFVHLTCLARCWAALPQPLRDEAPHSALLGRLEQFRSRDGGYDAKPAAEHGTVYGCFLALGAYQDLRAQMPDVDRALRCIQSLRAADGSYANYHGASVGLTPATAAAATLLRNLGESVDGGVAEWLLAQCHEQGGFLAVPDAPMPDLLSTATALHALSGLHVELKGIQEPCLDFIDSLWTSCGGFHGHWDDDELDCEYTYYGLLALGHLSL